MLGWVSNHDKTLYARTGQPDAHALQHALFRGVGGVARANSRASWGVMEQQPGPVHWAMYKPLPARGQIRLWLHVMLAHGSSLNNIFRWRQIHYGQGQMHAAMLRPDSENDVAFHEQGSAVEDIDKLGKCWPREERRRSWWRPRVGSQD